MFQIYADAMMVATRMDALKTEKSGSGKHTGPEDWMRLAAEDWAERARTRGLSFLGLL